MSQTKRDTVEMCFTTRYYTIFLAFPLLGVLAFHLTFLPECLTIMRSPVVRHCMMIVNHFQKTWTVPEFVYLVDGGLVDSLGVYALLQRRERWILAMDAAEPAGKQRFVQELIELTSRERLCSFSDPKKPWRHGLFALDDFERERRTYLHLKVFYEPAPECPEGSWGDLFIVFLKLPTTDTQVRRGLLERAPVQERVDGNSVDPMLVAPSRQGDAEVPCLRRNLHGVCCCDSCHEVLPPAVQRAGGKFPEISMANQFLTRQLFAELCQLGHELATETLKTIEREMAYAGSGAQPAGGRV